MNDTKWLGRTELLIGKENLDRLINAHVLIVGLGGVGSFAAEAICRSGVGEMTIVDGDVVDPSNRNRQLVALSTNHGVSKADIMSERLLQINPELKLNVIKKFLEKEDIEKLLEFKFSYVIDAIDSITPKLTLISTCYRRKIKLISSMGAGGRLDPTQVQVVDVSKTYNCNLAFYVRKRLKSLGISKGIKVVFTPEEVIRTSLMMTDGNNFKKSAFGTSSYLPAVFGLTCASVVIRGLIDEKAKRAEKREKKPAAN
jgi:tRNA A37 threonylcarbamoyladenosine dehydratase